MGFSSLLSKTVKTKEPVCIGLKFRGSINRYVTSFNGITEKKELRLLKRKSCPGCPKCGWIIDYFNEEFVQSGYYDVPNDLLQNIKHGKMYEPHACGGTDYESGIWELDYIDFREVKDGE